MNWELRPCKKKIDELGDHQRRENSQWVSSSPSSSSSSPSSSPMSEVIDEVLVEILIRLPSKSACICKAVCKRWHSTISTNYFIARYNSLLRTKSYTLVFQCRLSMSRAIKHSDLAISTHPELFKTRNRNRKRRTIHELGLCELLPNLFKRRQRQWQWPERGPEFSVEASSYDLLLCRCYWTGRYYVVNPLTRQWNVIPPAPSVSHPGGTRFRTGFLCLGNYVKFKVIRVPIFQGFRISIVPRPPECDYTEFRVQIFCSQSRKWTEFVVDWYPYRFTHYLSNTHIISHNGLFHWLNGRSLVSFDPFDVCNGNDNGNDNSNGHRLKLSHTLDMPVDLGLGSGTVLVGFGVCQGLFRIITQVDVGGLSQCALDVWELDEGVGTWRLVHHVLLAQLSRKIFNKESFKFIAFHPYNRDVVYLKIINSVYRLNLGTGKSERYQQLQCHKFDCPLENAVPPLLHQWFPTLLPSPQPETSSASASICHP